MGNAWIIYGATGYTGRLVAAQAKREGLSPVLAGRAPFVLEATARELGLEARMFSLEQPNIAQEALKDINVVAHCAGPFSVTSAPMRAACRRAGCHYVDITGEIEVFEAAHAEDTAAREAGVVVCPGVGFDVIPTDCVAASLKTALPDASHLALGFNTGSGISKGTATTAVEGLGRGGMIRRDGALIRVPFGYGQREINFDGEVKHALIVPWGDVATAWYSTGIPNIEVYAPVKRTLALGARLLNPLRPVLSTPSVQRWLKAQVAKRFVGPDEEARTRHQAKVWGEVRNPAGEKRTAQLNTANIYDVTIHGVLLAIRQLLAWRGLGGYYTPSQLLGERCIEILPGSGSIILTD